MAWKGMAAVQELAPCSRATAQLANVTDYVQGVLPHG
jgi:hypothetical protein